MNAVIVAGVSSTPGIRSWAKPSMSGSAAFRLVSEARAFSRVGPSSPIASVRLASSRANTAKKRLKLVMKSFSCSSLVASAVVTLSSPAISLARSCGSVPSSASFTSAELFSDLGASEMLSFRDLAAVSPRTSGSWSASSAALGLDMSPSPRPLSRSCSDSRSLVCSAVRSWSSCTGVEVRVTGTVSPSPIFGALGVPGDRSTKKLPSRKMRDRIFASRRCGSEAPSPRSPSSRRPCRSPRRARPRRPRPRSRPRSARASPAARRSRSGTWRGTGTGHATAAAS